MVLLVLIIVMMGQKINNVKVRNAALLTNDLAAYILGCPKKPKSPNFVSQLTPLVFIG